MSYGLFCIWKIKIIKKFVFWIIAAHMVNRMDFVFLTFEIGRRWSSHPTFHSLLRAFALISRNCSTSVSIVITIILHSKYKLFIGRSKNIIDKLTRLYGIVDTINTNQTTIYKIQRTSYMLMMTRNERRNENQKEKKTHKKHFDAYMKKKSSIDGRHDRLRKISINALIHNIHIWKRVICSKEDQKH